MKLSFKYKLATLILESSETNKNDVFGVNGLPITPASIAMVGNFNSFVRSFNSSTQFCPYLIHYLDCIRSKNGELTINNLLI